MKERIKELLGAGLSNSVVASAVGMTEGYISQLLSDETFAAEVQTMRLTALTDAKERDRGYDRIEDKLLDRLSDTIDTLVRPREIASILHVVNNAKRRATPAEMGAVAAQTIVNLNLPNVVAAKFTVNTTNQVVEVEGRSIATMPAKAVLQKLSELPQPEKPAQEEAAASKLSRLKPLLYIPMAEQL